MSTKRTKKCPICKNLITLESYDFHVKHGHDIGGDYDVIDEDDDYFEGFNEVDFLQPNLDGSKDIGYPCREAGAYGSFASHDGFDDESSA